MDATESFQLQNLYQMLCFGLVPILCVCTDAELQVNTCFSSATSFSQVGRSPRLHHVNCDVLLLSPDAVLEGCII